MKEVDLFVAVRRKKENPDLPEHCIRHIIRDYDKDLALITQMCQANNGVYRIYKTVNKRDTSKAFKEFQHKMIENPLIHERFESEWKTALLQPKCKASDKLLIDIDSLNYCDVLSIKSIFEKDIVEEIFTPNGYHIVINRVDTKILEDVPNVEVKKDALKFVGFANKEDTEKYFKWGI